MTTFKLPYKDVKDGAAQESFVRVQNFLRSQTVLKGRFEFREYDLKAPTYPATLQVPHQLLFVPKDILQTSLIGGSLTWNYDKFTQTALSVTISAPTKVRAFVGSYAESSII